MVIKRLKSILDRIENALFVNYSCINCGREIFENSDFSLCENCYKSLDIISSPRCEKCGECLGENLFCESCYNQKFYFDKNLSFCYYNDIASNIVKQFKYSGKKYYAKYIANIIAKNFVSEFEGVDYLTFVPATSSGKRERGYNQSEEIAKYVSIILNIPILDILCKNEGFKNQASLNQKERIENLKNAFYINKNLKTDIKDKNILIIDDVFTTGTTLSRCSEVILKLKPKSIKTITFAKTKFLLN